MIKLRLENDGILASLRQRQSALDRLPQEMYNVFVKTTPKDTGNARRQTKLRSNVIDANYPYAQPLDQGWSRQAPTGMTQPTLKYAANRLDKIFKGI